MRGSFRPPTGAAAPGSPPDQAAFKAAELHMATSDEVAAWLDLAEYARELSDKMSDVVQKETMIGLANLCETLAYRHPDDLANRPANDDTKPDA